MCIRDRVYTVQAHTDGSKHNNGVGSGIALFVNGELKYEMQYKLGVGSVSYTHLHQ